MFSANGSSRDEHRNRPAGAASKPFRFGVSTE
jgi:hypothetical protein